ncbi:MAG: glycosyltransferase family 2 protein [Candidatus Berkelbacteria bacterium]|nr:glycosyltransferase family 2 protein [Candidatus Berkelbacteria bacterium]
MKTLSLSVLIPTRNRKKTLKKCLESVFVQSLKPLEIIVSDDASGDGTVQYLKKLAKQNKIKPIFLKENVGMVSNKDSLASRARGDILCFIDDDIVLDRNYLETVRNAFRLDPKIAIVGGRVIEEKRFEFWEKRLLYLPSVAADHFRNICQRIFGKRPPVFFVDQACGLEPGRVGVYGNNLAIKRDVFNSLGGRDQIVGSAYEDIELCLRAYRSGYKIYRDSNAIAHELESGKCNDADIKYYLELRNRVYVYLKHDVLKNFFQKFVFGIQLIWGAFLAIIFSFKNPRFIRAVWGIFEGFKLSRRPGSRNLINAKIQHLNSNLNGRLTSTK